MKITVQLAVLLALTVLRAGEATAQATHTLKADAGRWRGEYYDAKAKPC